MRRPDAIEASQRKLLRRVRAELRDLAPPPAPGVAAYRRSFLRSLPDSLRSSDKGALKRAAAASRVVLVGDFHPFRQSQKGFLRIVREFLKPRERAILALEFVAQAHQPAIDQFQAGYITINELREMIRFDSEWPFSWESYREILLFGRDQGLQMLALNIPVARGDGAGLRARDEAAAARLAEALWAEPKARAFVLYGELHLARPHLPARLREALGPGAKVLVVHQNEISLYERAPRAARGQRPEVLQLSGDEFCVLNSVPWVKLRAYLDWLEGGDAQQDEAADVTELVVEYGKHLAELLELPSERLSEIEVVGAQEHEGRAAFGEATLHRQVSEFGRVAFLPSKNKILVPNGGTNAISESAALALWRAQIQGRAAPASSGSSARLRFMLGFLGSKILNPKRKCNEVKDMALFLRSASPRSPKAKVFARALSLLRPLHNHRFPARALKGLPELEAARIAGYVLGNRLFMALERDPGNLAFVRRIFSAEAANEKDADRWLAEALRLVRTNAPSATGKAEHF